LITDENGIYTNGGAYSFLNLLIYLIEKYYGRPTAIFCSKGISNRHKPPEPVGIHNIQRSEVTWR
jgi:hypothetical protein